MESRQTKRPFGPRWLPMVLAIVAISVGVISFFVVPQGSSPGSSPNHSPGEPCDCHPSDPQVAIDPVEPEATSPVETVQGSTLSAKQPEPRTTMAISLSIVDEGDRPLDRAEVRVANDFEDLYGSGVQTELSSESGLVDIELEGSNRTSVLIRKDGYLPELLHQPPSSTMERRTVVLKKPRELSIKIVDVDRLPLGGIDIGLYGRSGREARDLESKMGKGFLGGRLYTTSKSDLDGIATVRLHPDEPYELELDGFGYEPRRLTLRPERLAAGQFEVMLYPIVAAGIHFPEHAAIVSSLTVQQSAHDERRDGLHRLRVSGKKHSQIIAKLEETLGVKNVHWMFAVDRRPSAQRAVTAKSIRYRERLGLPEKVVTLEFKRVASEIGHWDVAQAAPLNERLIEVCVEFQDSQGRPVDPLVPWGLVRGEDGYGIVAMANFERRELSAGRSSYRLHVPEGDYSIKVIKPFMAPLRRAEFDPIPIQVRAGSQDVHLVTLNDLNARVRFECVDPMGRPLKDYALTFLRTDVIGFPRDERHRFHEGMDRPVAILDGACLIEVEAHGYTRYRQEFKFEAGQTQVHVVELEPLMDESQNLPPLPLEALVGG